MNTRGKSGDTTHAPSNRAVSGEHSDDVIPPVSVSSEAGCSGAILTESLRSGRRGHAIDYLIGQRNAAERDFRYHDLRGECDQAVADAEETEWFERVIKAAVEA